MNGSPSKSITDLDLAPYDVHRIRGFLPPPLSPLPSTYYAPWERLAEDLSDLLSASSSFSSSGQKGKSPLAQRIAELPLLSTESLSQTDENEWRRAHSILAFFVAAWIWGSHSGPQGGPNAVCNYWKERHDRISDAETGFGCSMFRVIWRNPFWPPANTSVSCQLRRTPV
jgi:hypothetical protein